jgi:lysyl endopeptidase
MHRTRPLLTLLLCLACLPAAATDLPVASVAEFRLPTATVAAEIEAAKLDPLHFAAAVPVNLDTAAGSWDEPVAGIARWRLRLRSDGASSLSLRLEALQLPAGAALRYSGLSGEDLQGPFGGEVGEVLWLPLVRAEQALLEATMPAAQRDRFALHIAEVFHGYRGFASGDGVDAKGQFGNSGSCNVNAICEESRWGAQLRSVVLLTRDNSALCTGTLVNNLRQDGRPLILTANHCGIRSSNIASVRAYFNVQKAACSGTSDGPINQVIGARRFLARDTNSDFTLIELANAPPASFNAFYAGWDARSGITPQSGSSIHHPAGDDKKISLYSSAARSVENQLIGSAGNSFQVDAWEVRWSSGTTQQGSSGAALWDQNGRAVGMLSGGGASCATPNEPDYFGRLERAWIAGGDCAQQLKAQLDPDNLGNLFLDGRNSGPEAGTRPAGVACSSVDGPTVGGGGGGLPLTTPLLLGLALLLRRRAQRR